MIELEKIKQAKDYIEMLADGVDPTTGEVLSDDTMLNNVSLSRIFFYVSDVLKQVIENNGITGQHRQAKQKLEPFNLPDELSRQIEITEAPAMIKHFTSRINSLIDESVMQKLKVTALTTWLVNNGFLCEEIVNDKKRKKPTEEGEMIGITSEFREGRHGNYLAILYNDSAQRHLVSNLDQIIKISNGDM